MSRSSGVLRTTEKHTVSCEAIDETTGRPCTFAGPVDVEVDPEISDAWWDCPRCGTQHDFEPAEEPTDDYLNDYWH